MDNGGDADDGRWLTYAELAEARDIDHQSARRLASRQKWRRQRDNHGIVRVYVPATQAEPHRSQKDMSADKSVDTTADISHIVSVLEAAVTGLRERAELADGRAELERARADRAEQARYAEQARAERAQAAAESAEAEAAALRKEDQARRARGLWARLRAAWLRE
jgi:hypothetical protein